MILRVLPEARWEAVMASIWYDDRHSSLGDEFLAELDRVFAAACANPGSIARLESYVGARHFGRCLLKRFPYNAIFEICAEELIVVAVAHTRRKQLYWLQRLK